MVRNLLLITVAVFLAVVILITAVAMPASGHHKSNHNPGATPTPTATPTPVPSPATGFVTRAGTQMLLNGQPYVFTGLNIYNANSRNNCWYSLGNNDGALASSLNDIGSGKEAFRAWFFQGLATTNSVRDWAAFDHTLSVAAAAGQKVVVVLTGEGGCGDPGIHWADWYSTGYKTVVQQGHTVTYRQYVSEIVNRYRNNPAILMWQIANEMEIKTDPNTCGSASTMKAFVDDIAAVIKSIDTNHLVSAGTIGTGQCGAQGSAAYIALHNSPNVDLCEFHDYIPGAMPGDQYNGLQTRLNDCNSLNKPLFVGEAGIEYTVPNRAQLFSDKLDAQIPAGVRGFLAWEWRAAGQTGGDTYIIGPGDATLNVLGR